MPIIYQNGLKIDSATGQVLGVEQAPANYQAPTNNEGLAGYDQRLKDEAARASSSTPTDVKGLVTYEDPTYVAERNKQAEANRLLAQTPVDDAEIMRKTREQFQAEIDASNRLYAEKVAEAKRAGVGRLGSEGAIQARRGLLGSDFGTAQTNVVEQANLREQNAIEVERLAAENAILSDVRTNAVAEAAAKRKAASEGADSYLKFLSEASARKSTSAKDTLKRVLASNMTFDDTLADKLSTELGIDKQTLLQMYQEEKAGAESAAAAAQTEAEKAQLEMSLKQADLTSKQAAATAAKVGKDYEYVSTPAQRDALKKQGYTEKIVDGKTYMKAPELTTKIEQVGKTSYLVTYDKGGKLVKKETIASSSTGGGSGLNKTEQKAAEIQADKDAVMADINAISRGQHYQTGAPLYDNNKLEQIRSNIAINNPDLLSWFNNAYPVNK